MKEKKRFVKEKFSRVTRGYDLVNSLGSFGRDAYWRRQAASELKGFSGPLLDLCAGTLALSLELVRQEPRPVVALDLTPEMLSYGLYRFRKDSLRSWVKPVCGDAEELPFPDQSFHGLTIAFGLRNLAHPQKGLFEMYRVLKPGGKVVILEFSRPRNRLLSPFYRFYLRYVLSSLGALITGDREAYLYLSRSIYRFPDPQVVMAWMEEAGFRKIRAYPLTLGVVTIYTGLKKTP